MSEVQDDVCNKKTQGNQKMSVKLWHKMESAGNSEIGTNPTVAGTPVFDSCKYGKGNVIGKANSLNFADIDVGAAAFTLDFWVKPPAAYTTYSYIFHWGMTVGIHDFEVQQHASIFKVGLINSGGGYNTYYTFNLTYDANEVFHLAMVFNPAGGAGEKCFVYKNGEAVTRASYTNDSSWATTHLRVWPYDNPVSGNNWNIDNIRVRDGVETNFDDRFWENFTGIPANVSATDGTYTDKVRVSWDEVVGDTIQYHIYRSDSELGTYTLIAQNITDLYYDDDTVSPGVTYWYKVKSTATDVYSEYSSADSGYAQGEDPPGNSFAVRRATLPTRTEKILVDGIDLWQREYVSTFPVLEYFRSFDQDRLFLNNLSITAFNIDNLYSVDNVKSLYKNINLRGKAVKIYDMDGYLVWDGRVYNYERNHNSGNITIQSLHRLYANRYDKIAYASADWETGADAVKNILDAEGITDYDLPSIYMSKGYLTENSCLLKVTITKDDNINLISALEQIAKYSNADCYDFRGKIHFRVWRPQSKFLPVISVDDDDILEAPTIKNYDKILRNDYSIAYYNDGDVPATDADNGNIGALSRTRNGTYSIDLTGDDKVLFKDLTSAVFFGEQSIRRTHRDLEGNPRPLQGMKISVTMDAGVWLDLQSVVKITFARESWVEKLFEIMYIGYDYERRILTMEMVEYAS